MLYLGPVSNRSYYILRGHRGRQPETPLHMVKLVDYWRRGSIKGSKMQHAPHQ